MQAWEECQHLSSAPHVTCAKWVFVGVPSTPHLPSCCHEQVSRFITCFFCTHQDGPVIFFSSACFNVVNYIHFYVKLTCIPGINSIWSQCIILFKFLISRPSWLIFYLGFLHLYSMRETDL